MPFAIRTALCVAALLAVAALPQAEAASFSVTRGDDPVPDGCAPSDCSLREAVQAANLTPGEHSIQLEGGTYGLFMGPLQPSTTLHLSGSGSGPTSIQAMGGFAAFELQEGAELELSDLRILSPSDKAIGADGSGSLRLTRVRVPGDGGYISVAEVDRFDLDLNDSSVSDFLICGQRTGRCHVIDTSIATLLVGGAAAEVDVRMQRCEVTGSPPAFLLLSGVILSAPSPLYISDCEIRNSLRPLALYQGSSNDPAPPALIERTRFLDNMGPLRGSRQGEVLLSEIEIRNHRVDPDSGLSSDYSDAPSVLLAQPGPKWRIEYAGIYFNYGVAVDGATISMLPGSSLEIQDSLLAQNTRVEGLMPGTSDGIGIYAGPGDPAYLNLLHVSLLRSNQIQAGGVGRIFGVRGSGSQVSLQNTLLMGQCEFSSGAVPPNALSSIESSGTTCGLTAETNSSDVAESLLSFLPGPPSWLADWGGFSLTRMPRPVSVLVGAADPDYCTERDQRRALRAADGQGCDIGAVQADAYMLLFGDDFEE